MKVNDPKANMCDRVQVLNYKCRPAKWEYGRVEALKCEFNRDMGYQWRYDVLLERANGKGIQCLWLYVSEDSIIKA